MLTHKSTGIRSHLRKIDTARTFGDAGFPAHVSCCTACLNDYETLFKELFCVAASDLAATIQVPLTDLGVLFDDVVSTGTLKPQARLKSIVGISRRKSAMDLETGNTDWFSAYGQGKLLFTVRQVSKPEFNHLQGSGFSFTNPSNVIDHLSQSMQINPDDFQSRLNRMRDYANCERILEPGVHLACFALRPFIQRGFDVLVRKDARNLLPTVKLPMPKLDSTYLNLLTQLDGMTVANCCETIRSRAAFSDECEHQFFCHLLKGIIDLSNIVGSDYLEEARLVAKPFRAPDSAWGSSGEATIIAFRTIIDIHELTKTTDDYEFAPLKFFMTQQHTYPGSPDIEIFARRIHREFEHILRENRTRQGVSLAIVLHTTTLGARSLSSHTLLLLVTAGSPDSNLSAVQP
ncbi:uncharacterized protein KY384_006824 [Bacidia gigantensis]|uniref:uncharacterized protein n=1 Tax=Bacidia gigantensis TaxID=2732470 RepID=UPI001D0396CA|nr:uncharacterized protein KY384_006824 [Bacidia gigantensis]KAG8527908.1 hypothetical protein KY384_006824 [Bacidia gigantensis]